MATPAILGCFVPEDGVKQFFEVSLPEHFFDFAVSVYGISGNFPKYFRTFRSSQREVREYFEDGSADEHLVLLVPEPAQSTLFGLFFVLHLNFRLVTTQSLFYFPILLRKIILHKF